VRVSFRRRTVAAPESLGFPSSGGVIGEAEHTASSGLAVAVRAALRGDTGIAAGQPRVLLARPRFVGARDVEFVGGGHVQGTQAHVRFCRMTALAPDSAQQ
jgi:hypothetical protein